MPASFDPQRLTIARKRAGLTKRELARRVDVSPASVTQYEAGRTDPRPHTIKLLAMVLGCPPEYFEHAMDRRRPGVASSPFYRSLRATRQWERDQAEALCEHLWDLLWALEREFELPLPELPDLGEVSLSSPRSRVEQAAEDLRAEWNIPAGGIGHAVRMLEAHGVIVARLTGGSHRLDAFSRWLGHRPVVLLWDTKDDRARSRFDACHELGHLLLHQDEGETTQVLERQASVFASALLMPADQIEPELPRRPPRERDWDQLFETRRRWGVSLAALFYRARELGSISQSGHSRAMIALSQAGLRTNEGQDLGPPEQPAYLQSAVAALLEAERIDLGRLASRLRLGHRQLLEVLGSDDFVGERGPASDPACLGCTSRPGGPLPSA